MLDAEFEIDDIVIEFEIEEQWNNIHYGDLPNYEGPYNITPKTSKITLPTRETSLLEDITIFQIPYAATDNPAGGKTIVIGLE